MPSERGPVSVSNNKKGGETKTTITALLGRITAFNVFATTLTALLLACSVSWAQVGDEPNRTMPHQETCAVPLPTDFWDDSVAEAIRDAEAWAWNERICLGHWADMRNAAGKGGDGEACEPAKIEGTGKAVPPHRELRPEFLELILGHERWVSAQRHPEVGILCSLVRGDVYFDGHEIAPSVWFQSGKIEGGISLVEAKFKRSLSLQGSTVTGELDGDGLVVGGRLTLGGGGMFAEIGLRDAKVVDSVSFSGSTVTGKLSAIGIEVGGRWSLSGGGTFAGIDLRDAKVADSVSFSGSTVTGELSADRLEVGGHLSLSGGGTFGDVDLRGVKVADNMSFNGSTVTGELSANRLEVGGDLYLDGGGTFADVNLRDAKVAGSMSFNGSTVTGELSANRLEVGGNLSLSEDGSFADILLPDANVAGRVDIIGSTITGRLNAGGLEVGRHLFLREGSKFVDIWLPSVRIGGDVQLAGSTFSGEINLTSATIGEDLHLSSERHKRAPIWQSDASLILRNARADALQARRDSWNISGKDALLPTDLTGFAYNQFGGIGAGVTNMGDESADWLIDWIEAQRDHGKHYDPATLHSIGPSFGCCRRERKGQVGSLRQIRAQARQR